MAASVPVERHHTLLSSRDGAGERPQLLSVTPKHFAEQLDVLGRRFQVVGLQDWVSERNSSDHRRQDVILTFDDGYADNLHEALPVLRAAGCPATIFITTGKIGDDKEFWWDELERLLLIAPNLPQALRLTIAGRDYTWQLASDAAQEETGRRWHVLLRQDPTLRQTVYLALCGLLRTVAEPERSGILDELGLWTGLGRGGRPSHRPLTSAELVTLEADELIEIGAHSVTHPSLAALSTRAQDFEISESKSMLELLLGKPVRSFSYPFGGRDDYDTDTIRLVREAGFNCACANDADFVHRSSDRYALPRFLVRDWDGDEFAKNLELWLDH